MGFWHTGYVEFHEHVGLDGYQFEPLVPQYICGQCNAVYESADELRKHRFEAHPLLRPAMFLGGRELGSQTIRITTPLASSDVTLEKCDRAELNGVAIPLHELPERLALVSSDLCRVVLSRGDVSAKFALDFRIAEPTDLQSIEDGFERIALGGRLDMRAIDDFIAATSRFKTAIGYCDGICAYLYGVLARERAADSSLPYEAYVGKYTRAVEELAVYDRPLARTIRSLVQFHFNYFREAARLGVNTRVAKAARTYESWLTGAAPEGVGDSVGRAAKSELESLVTDWETEQLLRWMVRPTAELCSHVEDVEELLRPDMAEYDRVKLHVLLAEIHLLRGDRRKSVEHAKNLLNLSALKKWAEGKIRGHRGD